MGLLRHGLLLGLLELDLWLVIRLLLSPLLARLRPPQLAVAATLLFGGITMDGG